MFYVGLALALASALAKFGFGFGLFLCVLLCFCVCFVCFVCFCTFLHILVRFCMVLPVFAYFFMFFHDLLCCSMLFGSWDAFGRSWATPGALWAVLGSLLGLFRDGLGRSWALLEHSWGALGTLSGPCWAYLAKNLEKIKKNHFLGFQLGRQNEAKITKNRCRMRTCLQTRFFHDFFQNFMYFWIQISMIFRSIFGLITKTSIL